MTLMLRELASLPVVLARQLPLMFTLFVLRKTATFVMSTSRSEYRRYVTKRELAFMPRECVLMAEAVEARRAYPKNLDAWLAQKRDKPAWTLSRDDALGMQLPEVVPSLTFGALFDELGAELAGAQEVPA